MQTPLVLMIYDTRTWLCRGDWNRPVERNQFVAWATYAGIELRSIDDSKSQLVVLSTSHQETLFDLMWVMP
jgi:hypothetical protein